MYLTQTDVIRHISKKEFEMLQLMCRFSNNLYNVALYNIRQYYFQEKKFLTYESNYHQCKANENYGLLQAGISQQILKVADRSFKSFFNLIKKAKKGDYRFHDIKIPRYKKKGDMFALVMSTNAICIKDGYVRIPISRDFAKQYGNTEIKICFPKKLKSKEIKEIRILPCGTHFKIQYCYKAEIEQANVDKNNYLAIDVGLNNLATCVSSIGTSFIMDGRKLKSINQYWNKRKAKLQSIADKQHQKKTKLIAKITAKRNRRVDDFIKKTARYIVNYCISHNTGTIVIGYNKEQKKSIHIGATNNQNFISIPFGSLRSALCCLCERYGLQYIEQEESYTSKASFLDNDVIPVYQAEVKHPITEFSGRRIYRGLYRSKDGIVVNADCNGACNIIRKSKQNFDNKGLCSGLLASPLRIRVV